MVTGMEKPNLGPFVYESRRVIVIDKPCGWLSVPSRQGEEDARLCVGRVLEAQLGTRLWPVHRLDAEVSGLLLFAKDADAHRLLCAGFEHQQVRKTYLALVRGWPPDAGRTDAPLARDPEQPSQGQPHLEASTEWTVLQRLSWPLVTRPGFPDTRVALVEVRPLTGRRHQIRRHFKQLGHPLIGDSTHGKGPLNRAIAAWLGHSRLWLHAATLELTHPETGEHLVLQAVPGPEWQRLALPTTPSEAPALEPTPGSHELP